MSVPELEPFLSPNSKVFIAAELHLIELGEGALPILTAFFSGSAINDSGQPYRHFHLAMRCALATVARLGPIAKPLEPFLRAELAHGDFMSADALGALRSLETESVVALAECITTRNRNYDLAWQAAGVLVKCGYAAHPAFITARESLRAEATIASEKLDSFIEKILVKPTLALD